ncbi:MAG: hypothetical protein ACREN6_04510 [Gemmatimonadaceae bacterium]
MTAPRHPRQSATTWWEDEGRRIAGQLHEVSAALVVGPNADHSARVALGIARAESERRHVALGDLVGDLAPLYAVAGGEDAFGLSDCLRQGLPLNDIARPAPDRDSLFILPAGSPPVACEEILGHERWRKLVNGFAKTGALLLLVAAPGGPGFDALAEATGGIVLVDAQAARTRDPRVLAAVSAAPEARPTPRAPTARGSRRTMAVIGGAALVAVAVVAAAWSARHRVRVVPAPAPRAAAPAGARTTSPVAPLRADTVRLADPVNPADTSGTTPFAVEVMAANTLAGANSYLADHARSAVLRGASVSPVIVGGSASLWYRVVVGAWHVRAGADSLLAALRHDGLVRGDEGRVVRVPYALLIADKLDKTKALSLHDAWRQRGFNSYLLVQDDGTIRLFAGAFETAAQAASLAAALRAARVAPVLAYRTGRTY